MKTILIAIGSFIIGVVAYAFVTNRAVESRDRLLEDYLSTSQALLADAALKAGDLEGALRLQQNALAALTSANSPIGADIYEWSAFYPLASEALTSIKLSAAERQKSRLLTEIGYRERLASLLATTGKSSAADEERKRVAQLRSQLN